MKPTNDPSLRCCPRCVQQDAVRQVSHVVAKGRGTVSEFGLARSMGAGESYWVGSGGILVSDLAAPLDPQLRRPWSVLWTVLGAIAVFWLGAPAVGCAALALLTVPPVKHDPLAPRALNRGQVERILAEIPAAARRDRVLFRLLFETGLRVGEALSLDVSDLALAPDDEQLRVAGKGGRWRTVLLDDPGLVRQLRSYLKQTGYRYGPLFRAAKNNQGGALRYQSVQKRWARYCGQAQEVCTLHQLRHNHGTELVNAGGESGHDPQALGPSQHSNDAALC